MAGLADHHLEVPSTDTGRIQEGQIFLGHVLCELVERELSGETAEVSGMIDTKTEQPTAGEPMKYFVHPSSYVDEGATIGDGTRIWYFCHVQKGASLGKDCSLGQNVNVDQSAWIGNGVKIQNNVSVYKGVIVEDDVFLGPSMVFTNVSNPRSHVNRKNEFRETRVGKGASIGANATIVCGHTVGSYAFVGAGAVVTRDVPAYALVTGNPARVRGWMCQCGIKLEFGNRGGTEEARCHMCGAQYQKDGDSVTPIETL